MVDRRSGNYEASIWSHDFIQSLSSAYMGDEYLKRAQKLKEDVKVMVAEMTCTLDQLELVDTLRRLGISYHFEDEIEKKLKTIYTSDHINVDKLMNEDLHVTALKFRLLREHGYQASQDVFHAFIDNNGDFKAYLSKDIKGTLSLYEASYLSAEDESILDAAREFTTQHLKERLERNECQGLAVLVKHALELPLHWRMSRLETRWFINVYETMPGMNQILLELAKLDFNMVQAMYQEEVKQLSKWYTAIGTAEKLRFVRDRLFESFLWTLGFSFEPHFAYCRNILTKLTVLITTIDDVYDVYGTLDELELFTDVIKRWDINAMERLPDYMKICFLALFNSINEMAYDILKEQGVNIISYLKKTWVELCNSYLVEAKWYVRGYTPSLNEYLDNGWISIAGPLIILHGYFCIKNPIMKEALEGLEQCLDITRWACEIIRFIDDLGTAPDEMERGDNPKSSQCYMHESGASEYDARNHIKCLIQEKWKKVNTISMFSDCPFSKDFNDLGKNFIRTAQCIYQHGDGHGTPSRETKKNLLSLVVEPIPLP